MFRMLSTGLDELIHMEEISQAPKRLMLDFLINWFYIDCNNFV